MRVTLSTMTSKIVNNLDRLTTDLSRVNDQISSGLQMSRLSDKPTSLATALGFRTTIAEITQFTENIDYGNNVINATESAYMQIKDMAMTGKTLAIQAVNGTLGQENFNAIAEQVNNLITQSISLGNTQLNGKYIFGGYRTTGYTTEEPAPFMRDKGDGHWINGQSFNPNQSGLPLTGAVATAAPTLQDISDGDLLINDTSIGAVDMTTGATITNGLNMDGANRLKGAVNGVTATTGVSATLTTLHAGSAATTGSSTTMAFTINGTDITLTTGGVSAAATAQDIVDAINLQKGESGVAARVGDGSNGGAANAVVLYNDIDGDESDIVISGLSAAESSLSGLSDGTYSVGAGANTGEVSLASDSSFILTSPNHNDDTILDIFGLGGGGVGFVDDADDGTLIQGPRLGEDDLLINGIAVSPPTADGLSDIYADASAAAEATAINDLTDQTGVTANVVPVRLDSSGPVTAGTETTALNGTVTNTAITAGDLAVNGELLPAIASGVVTNGLNMDKAANAKTAFNSIASTSAVTATLTTLHAGSAATATGTTAVSFSVNGTTVSLNTGGVSANSTAQDVAGAINDLTEQTGVAARVGDGTNGGPANSVVLYNAITGDEKDIELADISAAESALIGLSDGTYDVTAANTGEISLHSDSDFTITSTTVSNDSILDELGLGKDGTGIRKYGSTPKYLDTGDLVINGVDIFAATTAILAKDKDSTLTDAINAKTDQTGVRASHDADGNMILSVTDGRNLHIQLSSHAQDIIDLTGSGRDRVYYGTLQLKSDRAFTLQSSKGDAANKYEPGLAAIGLSGGESFTGEAGDVAGDGRIDVRSIRDQQDYVRYAGDRENDLAIKIGKTNTMTVSENGKTGLMDTGVFKALIDLRKHLMADHFTTVTGVTQATNTAETLNSHNTGLEPDDLTPDDNLFSSGSFRVTITDHDYNPASPYTVDIGVDPDTDTLDSVAGRIDALPHISASWNSEGRLVIASEDPDRYTIRLDNDSSNFLKATGTDESQMQQQAIEQDMDTLDTVISNLTDQISDFGARANRIDIQKNVFSSLQVATKENLSEVQDTDFTQAVMDLKTKQVAYQAALAAAAKTMQVSLVDYL